jgi:hypothetical protein
MGFHDVDIFLLGSDFLDPLKAKFAVGGEITGARDQLVQAAYVAAWDMISLVKQVAEVAFDKLDDALEVARVAITAAGDALRLVADGFELAEDVWAILEDELYKAKRELSRAESNVRSAVELCSQPNRCASHVLR